MKGEWDLLQLPTILPPCHCDTWQCQLNLKALDEGEDMFVVLDTNNIPPLLIPPLQNDKLPDTLPCRLNVRNNTPESATAITRMP